MLLDIPRLKVKVDLRSVTAGEQRGTIEAYAFAVTLLESRPLLFTVHTIDGAVYSRLPIESLQHEFWPVNTRDTIMSIPLDPWGAISSSGNVVAHSYLKDYAVEVCYPGLSPLRGMYAFTIDYDQGGFAQDPEQHKTSNIILLEDGRICAMPNNFCLFKDQHFTSPEVSTPYRRQKYYHLIRG